MYSTNYHFLHISLFNFYPKLFQRDITIAFLHDISVGGNIVSQIDDNSSTINGFLDLEYPNFDPKHGFLSSVEAEIISFCQIR